MNEFKKWFQKEKIKYPYRIPNEIDCGMGWNAALKWILSQHCRGDWDDGSALETTVKNQLPNY